MKIRVTSTTNLIAFLKKLKMVDRSVLLELKENKLLSKVHTPDKSVMKYASIDKQASSIQSKTGPILCPLTGLKWESWTLED